MNTKPFLLLCFIGLLTNYLSGQSAVLLKDINTGSGNSFIFSVDKSYVEYKDKLYFAASNQEFGHELWVYDGSEVSLFYDIKEGPSGSDVQNLYILNNRLFFMANDGVHGDEWWSTDGTQEGTSLFVDLREGSQDGVQNCCNSDIGKSIIVFNNELFFNGKTDAGDRLFKTDGTPDGTTIVTGFDHPQRSAENFTIHNGNLYFDVGFEGFWRTDGTTAGTMKIVEEDHEGKHFDPQYVYDMGDYMIMVNSSDWDIWKSDGTSEGTVLVKELVNAGAQNNQGEFFINYNGIALFVGAEEFNNGELWRSDGTESGTYEIIDLEDDSAFIPTVPRKKVLFKDLVYYIGGKDDTGFQIYKTDGTEEGTIEVTELDDWANGEVYFQSDLLATDNYIFFTGGNGFNRELWVSDGTAEGTAEIEINPNGSSTPERYMVYKDELVFFANGDGVGYEPYKVDISSLTVSSKENDIVDFNIYPNPAKNIIKIDSEENFSDFSIYKLNGQLLQNGKLSSTIDISLLEKGLYIFELSNKHGVKSSKRFVKLK